MIQLPPNMSADDVSQWLNAGYFYMLSGGNMVPVSWDGMDAGWVHGQAIDGSGNTFRARATNCYATWPELGSINVQRYAVHTARVTAKQYRRTMFSRAVGVTLPHSWFVTQELGTPSGVLKDFGRVVHHLFEPKYPRDLDDLDEWLASGWKSVALNRKLIVAGDPGGKRMLYLDGRLVANVMDGILHPIGTPREMVTLSRIVGGRYNVLANG